MDLGDAATQFAAAISETVNCATYLLRPNHQAESDSSLNERRARLVAALEHFLELMNGLEASRLRSSVDIDELREHVHSMRCAAGNWSGRSPAPLPLVDALQSFAASLGFPWDKLKAAAEHEVTLPRE